jgi:hypothetical protein
LVLEPRVVVDMNAEVARMNCGLVRRVSRTVHVADLGVVAGNDEEERKVEREAVEGWDVANGEGVLGVVHEGMTAEVLVDRIPAVVAPLVRQVSLGVGTIRNQEQLGCREVLMVAAEGLNRGYHLVVLEQSKV